jgi:regulator of replication initiation timing
MLAKGDVEGAMKALDKMASSMDQMLAGMKRTAGMPDEKAQALMKDMLAFKDQLEKVKAEQQRTAAETEKIRERYRESFRERAQQAQDKLKRLERLAAEARGEVEASEPGVTYRAQPEFDATREALGTLERALGMKELGAAYDTAQRAVPAAERLAMFLEEDEALSRQRPAMTKRQPEQVEQARKHASRAVPKVREVRDELAKLFPDPRQVLPQGDQKKLDDLSKRQSQLEQQAGGLQRQLSDLMQRAPVFPPSAPGQLGEGRGHMNEAASELGRKNPQRGRGEQELALDALSRFQKGLEQAAKKGGGSGGQGFPFPFAESGGEEEGGDGMNPSQEQVKIPGAEAHKVPEEFRKDLLDAMRQGAPERYRGEVKRYYEELVK